MQFECPRRGESGFDVAGALDSWVLNRWIMSEEEAERIQSGPEFGGTLWHWGWMPRSCSYCGAIHPDDALRLLDEGWTDEKTTKSYKGYLKPPHAPRVWLPVPPVKLYVQHFTDIQLKELNARVTR